MEERLITGALIKTAASGARFEIDENEIRRYNEAGQRVDLETGTQLLEDLIESARRTRVRLTGFIPNGRLLLCAPRVSELSNML